MSPEYEVSLVGGIFIVIVFHWFFKSVTIYWFDVLRILHNYMMWHVVKMMSTYLSKPFQDVKKDFIKVMSGATELISVFYFLLFTSCCPC